MADLNIRNVDPELLRQLKIKAAQESKSLKDIVLPFLWCLVTERAAEIPEQKARAKK